MPDDAILITGAAGFVGFHVAQRLLAAGKSVVGLDNLNAYYDPALKRARLERLRAEHGFRFVQADLANRVNTAALFAEHRFSRVMHLAAQAGVRHSIEHPHQYADANFEGFLNVLEGCRHNGCGHLLYASSSSVYGANTKIPFSVGDDVSRPISLYAASKRSNELMAYSYSHLYGLPTTGLRLFTVYGPWGRPDMAVFLFTRAILGGEPIRLFNHGAMQRDFTYIDDVAEVLARLVDHLPLPQGSDAAARIYNVGNHRPERLMDVVASIERATGRKAITTMLPMQPGDVPITYADVNELVHEVGFRPNTSIQQGVDAFVAWYRDYYRI